MQNKRNKIKNLKNKLLGFMDKEFEQFVLLLPIGFAFGIIAYFCLPFEPNIYIALSAFIASLGLFIYFYARGVYGLMFLLLVFISAGFLRVNAEALFKQAPFLHKTYHFVTLAGKVDQVLWQPSAIRLTITPVYLDKVPVKDRPQKVRIRLNGHQNVPEQGDYVTLKATLAPPALPFYPDGYSFARKAYFEQIGAVGYATSKMQRIPVHQSSFIEGIRQSILHKIVEQMRKPQSAIAVALVTGEQGLVPRPIRDNYTTAGIVHILSVSGFHMALIAAFIFGLFRFIFCLFPRVCERHNVKKLCALLSLILTFFYLLISGLQVPAIRSFGMIALVLVGLIIGRKVISLHSVFWIGFLILLISPQNLTTASFCLSFAAVIALVAAYEALAKPFQNYFKTKPWYFKYTFGTLLVFLIINLTAHFATAPIAIEQFHRYSNYAIVGNFCSSTLFSFLVMPLLFFAVVGMPFGLEKYPLLFVDYLLEWVGKMTEWICELPKAVVFLPAFTPLGYALILLGGLWLCLWKSKVRLWGLALIAVGLLSWLQFQTPDIMVAQGGKLYAVHTEQGFAFSSLKKKKSTRYAWLESVGFDPMTRVKKMKSAQVTVKGLRVDFEGRDKTADILINTPSQAKCTTSLCLPRKRLWQEGTHFIYIDEKTKNITVKSSGQGSAHRLWGQGLFSGLSH